MWLPPEPVLGEQPARSGNGEVLVVLFQSSVDFPQLDLDWNGVQVNRELGEWGRGVLGGGGRMAGSLFPFPLGCVGRLLLLILAQVLVEVELGEVRGGGGGGGQSGGGAG